MSIIEKAVNRLELGHDSKSAPCPDDQFIVEPAEDMVEAAVRHFEEIRAIPAGASSAIPADARLSVAATSEPSSLVRNINLARLRLAGMITPDGEKNQIAEEFRLIKRPLIKNAFNPGPVPIRNGNLVMVTSSFPGEGKSFCAINLAMSIAMEMDHTVLLVDADVAKPSVLETLGIKAEKGLMDVLLDENIQLADVLIKTNVDKLTILPAGRGHRYSTELLASDAMDRLLQEMAHRYRDRIIIFDSPPLLPTTEARVLATHMGQIVMVVEAGKTTHEALKESLRHIESCDVIGLLLNKGDSTISADYYYGSYGSYGA